MYRLVIWVSFLILLNACTPQTPEDQLKISISEMIELIDRGKSKELLAQYLDPAIIGNTTDLSKRELKKIRFHLLLAEKSSPRFSKAGDYATYSGKSFEQPLSFRKIGDRWLLTK